MNALLSSQRTVTRFNKSLLYQFLLFEFIDAYTEVLHLSDISQRFKEAQRAEGIAEIKGSINRLIGSSYSFMRLFSLNADQGLLTKLRNNCTFFLQHADQRDRLALHLHQIAQKTWILGLNTLDCLHSLELRQPIRKTLLNKFISSIDKICKTLILLGKNLLLIAQAFRRDENVLFFLLRSHHQIDQIFGKSTTILLFEKFFADGFDTAILYLKSRYAARGFDHLVLTIENLAKDLKSVACPI